MAKRPKYRFASREAAEEAERTASAYSVHCYRGMLALLQKRVRWLGRRGKYRVGVFDQDATNGPRVLFIFDPGGQSPNLTAADAHEWSTATLGHYTRISATDDESRGIVELAQLVQTEINKPSRR